MKKFKVLLTRDATESAEVEVEAENKLAALTAAYDKADDASTEWKLNENWGKTPYLGAGIDDDITEIKSKGERQ